MICCGLSCSITNSTNLNRYTDIGVVHPLLEMDTVSTDIPIILSTNSSTLSLERPDSLCWTAKLMYVEPSQYCIIVTEQITDVAEMYWFHIAFFIIIKLY